MLSQDFINFAEKFDITDCCYSDPTVYVLIKKIKDNTDFREYIKKHKCFALRLDQKVEAFIYINTLTNQEDIKFLTKYLKLKSFNEIFKGNMTGDFSIYNTFVLLQNHYEGERLCELFGLFINSIFSSWIGHTSITKSYIYVTIGYFKENHMYRDHLNNKHFYEVTRKYLKPEEIPVELLDIWNKPGSGIEWQKSCENILKLEKELGF